MIDQQENDTPNSERPSFFGLPPRLRFLSRALFWGGVLFGAGWGFLLAPSLVSLGVLHPDPDRWGFWPLLLMVALIVTGQLIAERALRDR